MIQFKRDMNSLLRQAYESEASDLHLSAGSPPMLRIDGSLRPLPGHFLTADEMSGIAEELLSPEQAAKFHQEGEADFAVQVGYACRFRLNVFRQQAGVGIAARVIPLKVPSLEELELPEEVRLLTMKRHGLILVTGPTGSGKSSTLAAMIEHMNQTQQKHVITLEDPIEFVHSNAASLIHQREVGTDTASFAQGIRAALRQDPDVILVGELRDLETISAAMTAAETGHLVLGTMHTTDAPQTIDRIIDAFPGHQQPQIRAQLASVLTAVISQRLLPRKEGKGRISVTEMLVNTPAVANLIRSDKNHQIRNIMLTGRAAGMHTMDMSIRGRLQAGLIDVKTAQPYMTEGSGS